MTQNTALAERVTEIVSLLRPAHPPRLPESLTAAALAGDVERMKLFVERGADINERSVGFASPLGAACSFGELESARWLIAHGALLDPPGATFSPMQSALSKANCEAAALLLEAGLPIERAAWGVVAAASMGNLAMLRWLLARGLELDRSYPGVGTLRERALHNAKKESSEELIRFLRGEIELGPGSVTPPAAPLLRKEHPRAEPHERERLIQEACDAVRSSGRAAASWNASGRFAPSQRQRLICFAAATGVTEIVLALLDAGAPPNAVPDGTPPPLTAAAAQAQVEVLKLLLERGALPDGADGKSWLPLASAAQSGNPQAVQILLEAGANPRAKPAGGPKLVDCARGPFAQEIRALLEQAAAEKASASRAKRKN